MSLASNYPPGLISLLKKKHKSIDQEDKFSKNCIGSNLSSYLWFHTSQLDVVVIYLQNVQGQV